MQSIAPLVAPREAADCAALATEFVADGTAAALRGVLNSRAGASRNWLEDWWLEVGVCSSVRAGAGVGVCSSWV